MTQILGRLWPAGLRWRLSRGTAALLLALLVAVGVFQYAALRQFLLTEQAGELRAEARYAVGALGGVGPAAADPAALARAASGPASRAAVYDPSGRLLALAPPGPAGLNWIVPPLAQLGVAHGRVSTADRWAVLGTGGRRLLAVAAPVGRAGSPSRVLVLESLLDRTDATLRGDLVIYAVGAAAALLAGSLLGVVLTGRALAGLGRVAGAAAAVAGGDLDRRARVPGRDEVAALGAAFDDMVGRLQAQMTRRRESEAAMRRFLDDTSHELRTPLAVVRGNLDVLRRRQKAPDPVALDASLADMHAMTVRMSRLVDDLLVLARLDQGHRLAAVDVDLEAALAEAVRAGRRIAPDHPFALELTAPLTVLADPDALGRVLLNLVDNAARYSPPGAPVVVRGQPGEAGRARVEVVDRGPGIPPEEQAGIFERFRRAGGSTSATARDGSGLGLAIAAALVRRQGGAISVRSEPGRGSTFAVELPLAPAPAVPTPPGRSAGT
jgi:two-component system OmpR family sensor kinase